MPKERRGRPVKASTSCRMGSQSYWLDFYCISLILQTVFPCFRKLYSTMLREGRAEKAGTSCRMGSQSVRCGSLTSADVVGGGGTLWEFDGCGRRDKGSRSQLILRENTELCASKTIIAGLC